MSTQLRQHTIFRPRTYRDKVLSTRRESLIAYWPLGEPAGARAFDASGYERNGTYSGVDLAQPGIGDGGSASFWDGVNDQGNLYSASLANAWNGREITLSLWVRLPTTAWNDGTQRRIVHLGQDGSNRIYIEKLTSVNSLQAVYFAAGVSKVVAIASGGLTAFLHAAITMSHSNSEMRGFFQGSQVGSTQTSPGIYAGTLGSTLCGLGCTNGTGTPTNITHGSIGHVALWSTALTPGEIAQLAVNHG